MKVQSLIIDGFYENPDEVRQFALSQEFGVKGNYPGQRTISYANDNTKEFLANILRPQAGEITIWNTDEYNGAYQYTTQYERSWIHADGWNTWAGVVYLTPNAPLSGGTGIFRHKETGLTYAPRHEDGSINDDLMNYIGKDAQDMTKWDMVDRLANVYNRLVLYRGDLFHQSLDYFGNNKENGRLFQTFFFSTEY